MFRGYEPRTTEHPDAAHATDPGMLVFTKANGHICPLCPAAAAAAGLLQGLCRAEPSIHVQHRKDKRPIHKVGKKGKEDERGEERVEKRERKRECVEKKRATLSLPPEEPPACRAFDRPPYFVGK